MSTLAPTCRSQRQATFLLLIPDHIKSSLTKYLVSSMTISWGLPSSLYFTLIAWRLFVFDEPWFKIQVTYFTLLNNGVIKNLYKYNDYKMWNLLNLILLLWGNFWSPSFHPVSSFPLHQVLALSWLLPFSSVYSFLLNIWW